MTFIGWVQILLYCAVIVAIVLLVTRHRRR